MSSILSTLQMPLTVAVLAQCLGLRTGGANPARHSRRRPQAGLQSRRHRSHSGCDAAAPGGLAGGAVGAVCTCEAPDAAGCGWFDSSHELHQGLVVLEHTGVGGLGAELPLVDWLGFVLGGAAPPAGLALQPCGQGIITA